MEQYYDELYQGVLDHIDGTESYHHDVFKGDWYANDMMMPSQYAGNEGFAQDVGAKIKQFLTWVWNKLKSLFKSSKRAEIAENEEQYLSGTEARKDLTEFKTGYVVEPNNMARLKQDWSKALKLNYDFIEMTKKKNAEIAGIYIRLPQDIRNVLDKHIRNSDTGEVEERVSNILNVYKDFEDKIKNIDELTDIPNLLIAYKKFEYSDGLTVARKMLCLDNPNYSNLTGWVDGDELIKEAFEKKWQSMVSAVPEPHQKAAHDFIMKLMGLYIWFAAQIDSTFKKSFDFGWDVQKGKYFTKEKA